MRIAWIVLAVLVVICECRPQLGTGNNQDYSSKIGSRPPSCANKCNTCNPCNPVQVPTQQKKHHGKVSSMGTDGQDVFSEYANYKPEGWKCKCGDKLFNP